MMIYPEGGSVYEIVSEDDSDLEPWNRNPCTLPFVFVHTEDKRRPRERDWNLNTLTDDAVPFTRLRMDDVGPSVSQIRRTLHIPYPINSSLDELCQKLLQRHNLPDFVLQDMYEQLEAFVADRQIRDLHDAIEAKLTDLKQHPSRMDHFKKNVHQITNQQNETDSADVFLTSGTPEAATARLYKKLLHSASLSSVLNIEHTYAGAVQELIREQNFVIEQLEIRQRQEMDRILSGQYSDSQINTLAQRHVEQLDFETNHWEGKVKQLKAEQKQQFHEWLMQVEKDPDSATMSTQQLIENSTANHEPVSPQPQRLEESFTIQLGAQLKTTHNLRLLSVNPLDMCRLKSTSTSVMPDAHRVQTALSLFSDQLSALILLVDDRLTAFNGVKREFAKVCSQSTDFHFPEIEEQLEDIENELSQITDRNESLDSGSITSVGLHSVGSSASLEDRRGKLDQGMIYITRHSNLSEVHQVFHIVSDETLLGDINSRHPIILALRTALKYCYQHQIKTLSIPLFLNHEMSEEMTIPWCSKRAELVFKCVKGFMMEMGTWADSKSKIIQFLVPPTLNQNTFSLLSGMLPSIFRQSNPIIASQFPRTTQRGTQSASPRSTTPVRTNSPRNVSGSRTHSPRPNQGRSVRN